MTTTIRPRPSSRHVAIVSLIGLLAACSRAPAPATTPGPTMTARLDSLPARASGTNTRFAFTLETTASAAAVWRVWTAVAQWPTWDTELASASLDGPFVAGARGTLVPTSGRRARFTISALLPDTSYTFTTGLPLASLHVRRTLGPGASDGHIRVTHEVWFDGLLGGVFASRFGPRFRAALPQVVAAVVRRAEAMAAPSAGAR